MAVALSNLSARWAASASAVNTAIKMKVTDTTSAANSKLIEFTVNDVSKFAVEKSGNTFAESLTVNYIQANSINVINSTVVNEIEINVVTNVITANAVVTSNVLLAGLNTFTYIVASRDHANNAYAQANTARTQANAALDQANTARTHANTAYDQANTARTAANVASPSIAQANTARDHANAAFAQANTARTQANTALTTGQAAFAEANTSGLTLLGTLGPFSSTASPQALSGLTLTNYKMIVVVLDGVDPSSSVTARQITLNGDNILAAASADPVYGIVTIDIVQGVGITVTNAGATGAMITSTTTASTSLSFATAGTFVSGSLRVYGMG